MRSIALVMLIVFSFAAPRRLSTAEVEKRQNVAEEIWALEEAYLTYHQHAQHEKILSLWHDQFLGWPDLEPQPADKKAATRRLQRNYPTPASWTFTIERAGIRVLGNVAVNHYRVHFLKKDEEGQTREESRRITHTWVREGVQWRMLGGMSDGE